MLQAFTIRLDYEFDLFLDGVQQACRGYLMHVQFVDETLLSYFFVFLVC